MTTRGFTTALIALAAFGLSACAGTGAEHAMDDKGGAAAPAMPSEEEMTAAWTAYMTPSAEHAKMAEEAGTWNVAGKMWMAPDAPPVEMGGTSTIRMTFDGRYQIQEYASEFPMGEGLPPMPFQGMGLTGYDNATHEFTSVWIDSMGTGTMITKGRREPSGELVTRGEMVMPTGDKAQTRLVLRHTGKDSFVFEMYMTTDFAPGESKSMELVYTRAK